jgi:hypothetical protein
MHTRTSSLLLNLNTSDAVFDGRNGTRKKHASMCAQHSIRAGAVPSEQRDYGDMNTVYAPVNTMTCRYFTQQRVHSTAQISGSSD